MNTAAAWKTGLAFALEIIANIRSKVGSDYPILYRFSGEEKVAGGLTIEDNKKIAPMLVEQGVDYCTFPWEFMKAFATLSRRWIWIAALTFGQLKRLRKWYQCLWLL